MIWIKNQEWKWNDVCLKGIELKKKCKKLENIETLQFCLKIILLTRKS